MRTIKMTTGAELPLDGDLLAVMETLYHEVTAKRELERTFEDMVQEIQHLIDQMTDDERRQYLAESLFLNFVSYENERLGAYMKKLPEESLPCRVSLNYLATRFTCSWPWNIDGACSATAAWSAAAPIPTASASSATRARQSVAGDLDRASARRRCARDLNAGGSKFCGDCPLKLPLQEGRGAAAAAARRRRRCRRGCTSSARPPATSRAPRPAARRRPASRARARPACSTSTCSRGSSTRPGPSLGRIDFFNYGEAFLHKRAVEMCEYIKTQLPAHLSLHEHQRPGASPRTQARRLVHSGHRRGHLLDRRRDRRRATSKYRQRGDFDKAIAQPARDGRREARAPAATCRSSTGATSSSRTTTATRRWSCARTHGGRDRRRSPVLGDDRSSRGHVLAPVRARAAPELDAIRHEIWDDNNLGNAIPGATPRARDRRARPAARTAARRRVAGRPMHVRHDASATCRRARSRRRRATAGGWCASARSCARRTARSSNRDFERAWLPATLQPAPQCGRADRRSPRPTSRAATR